MPSYFTGTQESSGAIQPALLGAPHCTGVTSGSCLSVSAECLFYPVYRVAPYLCTYTTILRTVVVAPL